MLIRKTTLSVLGAAAFALATSGAAMAEGQVEVIHWWTAGGEAKALNVLKENLEKQGISWKDGAVAGGSGQQARTVLKARVAAGNPPTTMQMLGLVIGDYAAEGLLGNLDALAEKEKWDQVVPPTLQKYMKPEGYWAAAPVNIHSTNWVWANKSVLDEVGAKQPTNWDEFVAVADKVKAAGKIPLAWGGQPWQEATAFEAIVNATGGPEFYRKAFNELDLDALKSDTMVKAFDRFRKIKDYIDPNAPGRDWNLATAMVMRGEAAMQMMGDWAKGEFLNAGMKPGEDFLCFRFPGTQGSVSFNTDAFAMFKVGEDAKPAQMALASAVMDPKFQEAFNLVKGSVPARMDVPDDNFDACGKKAIKDLAEAVENDALVGSLAHGFGAPEGVKGAMFDVITNFFNSDVPSKEAAQQLSDAVAMSL